MLPTTRWKASWKLNRNLLLLRLHFFEPIAAKSMSKPLNRVDGRLKVTGTAKCPAEFAPANAAHAFLVMSTIARGQITAIDSAEASTSKPKHRGNCACDCFQNSTRFCEWNW